MSLKSALVVFCLVSAPAIAGVREAVQTHAIPAAQAFAKAAGQLDAAAENDCTAKALRPSYQAAFDAWAGLSHLRLGPVEDEGRVLAISFWPDKKGMVARSLAGLIDSADPVVEDAAEFATVSIAARGLFALERLLYDDALSGYAAGGYDCKLAQAIATDLARMASDIAGEWQADFGPELENAGQDGSRYLEPREAAQALYTALDTGLEWNAEQRIGRPLGTFERPRPQRAEAWRSHRPLRNVTLSLKALRDLAHALADAPTPATDAAFADALQVAENLDDPDFTGVDSPAGRLKAEILQQRIEAIRHAVANEVGAPLGVSAGFNSSDGD